MVKTDVGRGGATIARWPSARSITVGAIAIGLVGLGGFSPKAAWASGDRSRDLPAPVTAPITATVSAPPAVNPAPVALERRLVLRLGERRLYLYEGAGDRPSRTYPVAVGRSGWETPTGRFAIRERISQPIWQHPFKNQQIPPGEDNPLGSRWLGFWTDGTNSIGFHGTPNPESIGRAASHGCVRLYDRDIIDLFDRVEVGTPVIVEP